MPKVNQREVAKIILNEYGRTYADEMGIRLKDWPSPLFQLLCGALLMSARISAENSTEAARALRKAKLTTPKKMAEATWQDRVDVLTANGYKRYDESGSRMLGDTSNMLLEKYDGDLRKLREEAARDVETERELLQEFKGIGKVGADIFLREVQAVWDEAYPFVDDRVTKTANTLGLPGDARKLSKLVSRKDFPRLVAGIIRVSLANAEKDVQEQAAA